MAKYWIHSDQGWDAEVETELEILEIMQEVLEEGVETDLYIINQETGEKHHTIIGRSYNHDYQLK